MRCDFKYCLHPDCEDTIIPENSKKKYHSECWEDIKMLQKVGDLWIKYKNDTESWAYMYRLLHIWYLNHGAEYILFCVCRIIREKRSIKNFSGIYYALNDLEYKQRYKEKDMPKDKYFVQQGVSMTIVEKEELLKYMGNNEVKFNYYVKSLNDYMESTKKTYPNHAETIKLWYDKEELKKPIIQTNIINKLGGRVSD